MSPNERLDVVYTQQMNNHPEGHALYKPTSATKLRPSVCGYFDRDGDWQKVVDLTDKNALRLGNWMPLEGGTVETDTGQTYWGPKYSEHVKDINAGIKANVNVPTVPVGGTIEAAFKSSKSKGAVLITDPPVQYHQGGNEKLFIRWMSANAKTLLAHPQHGEMIREFGAWIITKTYTTTRRAVAVLSSSEMVVNVSFGVTASNAGSLAPSAAWWNRASESSFSIHSEPAGVVVFMSGVEFRPRFMSKTLKAIVERNKRRQPTSRSGGFDKDRIPPITVSTYSDEDNDYQLIPTIVGELSRSLTEDLENEDEDNDKNEAGEGEESVISQD